MPKKPEGEEGKKKGGVSKTALVLGAAGLFLFIVGVKRRHRLDEEREIGYAPRRRDDEREEPRAPRARDEHAAD